MVCYFFYIMNWVCIVNYIFKRDLKKRKLLEMMRFENKMVGFWYLVNCIKWRRFEVVKFKKCNYCKGVCV